MMMMTTMVMMMMMTMMILMIDDNDDGDDDDDDDDAADGFANRWDYVPTNITCLVGGLKHFHFPGIGNDYPALHPTGNSS